MPTKKKRVGFIPREDVMKIINKLSVENNLSNSKIISILVEEALSMRGILNNKTGKVTQSFEEVKDYSENLSEDLTNSEVKEKFKINTLIGTYKNNSKANLFKQTNQDNFDLQIYKKFLSFLKFQDMMDEYYS